MSAEGRPCELLCIEEGLQARSVSSQHLVPQSAGEDALEDQVELEPAPLSEDLYGVGIATLLRDSRSIALGRERGLRFSRISLTTLLLFGTILMQGFLVFEFKRLVAAHAVHEAREVYDKFEVLMYDRHTTKTVNGFHRGIDGYFNASRFADMTRMEKKRICQIPLSQPFFFGCILAIWSLTVVNDIRKMIFLLHLLIIKTPTVDSLKTMLQRGQGQESMLQGLPLSLKGVLLFFMFLPRLIIDGVLLWLGCRWLTATDTFADVLLNAMALEFILLLKDLLYEAVVPLRDKYDTTTMLIPSNGRDVPSVFSFLGTFTWVLVVMAWVALYMFRLQQVLPDYKWDVRGICEAFIAQESCE
mmetsp:Transcript_51599/g.160071  ORF Transcript_51599/g.160071 Transcript_51599/m.160071 type:complete len:358 (-) Transcript_51599:315-1388(-)